MGLFKFGLQEEFVRLLKRERKYEIVNRTPRKKRQLSLLSPFFSQLLLELND
jgi:hypothetical protein